MSVRDDSCFAQRTTFILNKKCDKHCPFCVQNEMKGMKDLSDDEIFSNFNKCIDHIEGLARIQVQIMGGEPTLWSDVLVWKIQQRLRDYDRYLVFTNGSNRESLLENFINCDRLGGEECNAETFMVTFGNCA